MLARWERLPNNPLVNMETNLPSQASNLSRNEELVLSALHRVEHHASAYAILDMLRTEGFKAPPQVYRALAKLCERGMVHRLESLNAYVACARPDQHRTAVIAFAICDDCGHVDEFDAKTVEDRLERWTAENRFHALGTTIEIHGKCANCHGL